MFRECDRLVCLRREGRRAVDVRLVVDARSVYTRHRKRDQHLRSADFLNAAEFPRYRLHRRTAKRTGERTFVVEGQLRDARQDPADDAERHLEQEREVRAARRDAYVMGVSARGSFKRSAFGMSYGDRQRLGRRHRRPDRRVRSEAEVAWCAPASCSGGQRCRSRSSFSISHLPSPISGRRPGSGRRRRSGSSSQWRFSSRRSRHALWTVVAGRPRIRLGRVRRARVHALRGSHGARAVWASDQPLLRPAAPAARRRDVRRERRRSGPSSRRASAWRSGSSRCSASCAGRGVGLPSRSRAPRPRMALAGAALAVIAAYPLAPGWFTPPVTASYARQAILVAHVSGGAAVCPRAHRSPRTSLPSAARTSS